jgi:Raf kinase inhibitor-like YbhB/YbcL family protein
MKKLAIFSVVIFIVLLIVVIFCSKKVNNINQSPVKIIQGLTGITNHMQISSSAFGNAEKIPSKYTCDGTDILPPLRISDVPSGAKSLAIIMDDPDSPSGDFLHWTAWNILPANTEIAEGKAPGGAVEGKTDFGKTGYGGPCPSRGEHRYVFHLYALDTVLDLTPGADRSKLEAAIAGHVLEQAEFYGLYKRVGN